MKKTLAFLLIVLFLLPIVGCAKQSPTLSPSATDSPTQSPAQSPAPTPDLGIAAVPDTTMPPWPWPEWIPNSPYNKMSNTAQQYGITSANYPRIDGSTSTGQIVWSIFNAMVDLIDDTDRPPFFPWTPSKTVPSYEKLIAGEVDLILVPYASQDVLAKAEAAGVKLSFTPFVAEALVMITPKENTTVNITQEQIKDIYVNYGIKNWSRLGGPDCELIPLCRNADSGSQSQLENFILHDTPMHPDIEANFIYKEMDTIVTATAFHHDPLGAEGGPFNRYAMGYTLYTYLEKSWYDGEYRQYLKYLSVDGVQPTNETIADGTYPLTTAYYAVVREDLPADHAARRIIDYLKSDLARENWMNGMGYTQIQ